MSDEEALLRCEDLVVDFRQRGKASVLHAVDHASLDVKTGEIVGLVGESGSGKSTIARAIVGLQTLTSGSIRFKDHELRQKRSAADRRQIQMVFQNPYGSLDPRMSIKGTLAEMIRRHTRLRGREVDARCRELMDMVRLPGSILEHRPSGMSGGQRQRVAIARALSVDPSLLVADEPVAALDVSVQASIVNLLFDLRDEMNLSILFISHDLSIIRTLCDRVNVIYHGEIVEEQECARLFDTPESDYTKTLLDAIPRLTG